VVASTVKAPPGGTARAGPFVDRARNQRPNAYLECMSRKQLIVPPATAKAFAKDMRAFNAAATGFEKDEIAARQLHALSEHQGPRDKPLRLTDVHEMFLAMKDHA
jgi:hypothetical protein